ncbi:hypothetical protein C7974DRAFT_419028 [Boeremia exigua]|uniref:uncharacterized protein n=1 Tax=Boeremia exigua TaxID=749465 RepID=UPI001E8D635C|nr:uncharacterized protein C7974DRAFT_419028 [Boeremia exigua]KAH6612129.1 hypothetical protein C7974DRAFT_419028 [Boeremia exigua]
MDIPPGHAMPPLTDADFRDFVYNYFKAEYAPLRSIWSTATAEPRQAPRWTSLGHEISPQTLRPANAQAQKDLSDLALFVATYSLPGPFISGLVARFARYESHSRLDKKLFECGRWDLLVRKARVEKRVVDCLWPLRGGDRARQAQGGEVRRWFGDMVGKYFERGGVGRGAWIVRADARARVAAGGLVLVPFVEHLGAGEEGDGLPAAPSVRAGGAPERFEIRFEAPARVDDTFSKTVVRACKCLQCGTARDVQVVVSVDPHPGGGGAESITANTAVQRRLQPGARRQDDTAPPYPEPRTQTPPPPEQKKQCPRCTFLNHASLTECEMCAAPLPASTVSKPPSPVAQRGHAHSASLPPPVTAPDRLRAEERPAAPNRHSLSASLFSIFPFAGQVQGVPVQTATQTQTQAQNAETPAAAPVVVSSTAAAERPEPQRAPRRKAAAQRGSPPPTKTTTTTPPPRPASPQPNKPSPPSPATQNTHPSPLLSRPPEMTLMPLTPSPPSAHRAPPAGLPGRLMDDYPVSPALTPGLGDEEGEGAGWGELRRGSRDSSRDSSGEGDSEDDEDEDGQGGRGRGRGKGVFGGLEGVGLEERGVWGEED